MEFQIVKSVKCESFETCRSSVLIEDTVDFSELPSEILKLILEKLDIFDQTNFSIVCLRWRSVFLDHGISSQVPLLMLPDKADCEARDFFSLSSNRIRTIELPEIHQKWCWGSSEGWIMTLDEKTSELHLWNPFSNGSHFQLPSLHTFTESQCRTIPEEPCGCNFVSKFSFSSSPFDSTMAIVGVARVLSFHQLGDEKWTSIENTSSYDDVVFYDGQFYAVTSEGALVACEVGPNPKVIEVVSAPPELETETCMRYRYLVVLSGELLMVERCLILADSDEYLSEYSDDDEDDPKDYSTKNFEVFKLDRKAANWTRVESLDSHSLFLGMNSSVAISTTDSSYCRENCIYFTDDLIDFGYAANDMGVFNLKDKTVEPFYRSSSILGGPAIWITPNLLKKMDRAT